jgi:hypothetical protein
MLVEVVPENAGSGTCPKMLAEEANFGQICTDVQVSATLDVTPRVHEVCWGQSGRALVGHLFVSQQEEQGESREERVRMIILGDGREVGCV